MERTQRAAAWAVLKAQVSTHPPMNTPSPSLKKPFLLRLQLRLAQARFFTFSALLHVVLVIIGGSVVLIQQVAQQSDFEPPGGVLVTTDPAAQPPKPDAVQVTPTEFTPPSPNVLAPPITVMTAAAPSAFHMSPTAPVPTLGRNLDDVMKKAADEAGKGAAEMASGMGREGGTMMRMFNVQAKAQNVVFVVDVSGSMISGGKTVKTYEVLEREVVKVINGLSDRNAFGIVVFSKDAALYRPQLVRANNEEKGRGVNWLKKISPDQINDPRASEEERQFHHGTRADLGLARAFAMQPDTIFFISDGEPSGARPPEILQQVQALQSNLPQPVTIHAIAFHADDGQKFMQELAAQNRGTFREVR